MRKERCAIRLKQALSARNMKQSELSEITKIPKSAISQYISGAFEPKQDRIYLIGKALNVNEAWLMGFDVLMERSNEFINDDITSYNPIVHRIPVLGYISAGLPLFAEEHIKDYTYTERNGGAEYFALRIKGDSMSAAQINEGNIVIVRKQECVENGEIAVVRVGKENATVKRFKKDGNIIQLIPQSFNPKHEIQIYDLKDTEIRVIGKVVECKVEF